MYEFDKTREPLPDADQAEPFTKKHPLVLAALLGALVLLVIGAICWHWGILELSGLFFGLALVAGPLGGLSLDDTVRAFTQGAADITYAALIVGLARATLVVLRDAQVIDTITHALVVTTQGWSSWLSAVGIYLMQNLLHFIVPSGSGQAAVSMPILAPLGDLVGVTRQTNVLAYQLGNGLTNVFIPTQGYFMAALGILKIPWTTWVRWLLPLLATMVVVGMLQQIMTVTGVRGLLSFAVISTPLVLLFFLLPVIIPFSEGILTYGGAAIIGIPLIWFLDSIGFHATVVIAGLSLLWPLGDGLPPTALIGRLSNMVSGYDGSYKDFLKATWLPWLVITAVGMAMIIFSSKLAFLVKWSM